MNLENTFFWIAVASCAVLLGRIAPLLRAGQGRGWAAVSAAILAVAGAGTIFFPAHAGVVAGTLWAVFIALPSFLIRLALRNALGQRYARAERFARAARWLHPADGWREFPQIYRALTLAQIGRREQGVALLDALADRPGVAAPTAQAARVYRYRMQGQWEEFLAWSGTLASGGGGRAVRAVDPALVLLRVRACGETGRLGDMLRTFQDARRGLERLAQPGVWASGQLNLFAFGGREAAVAGLLEGPLATLTPGAKAFWRATAKMAAGQPEAARADLRELAARSDDQELRQVVARRLTHDLADARTVLRADEQATLDRIETESRRDLTYHPPAAAGLRGAPVTLALVLLNLGVFALEVVRGGSQNPRTLSRLGALWSPAVLAGGQWYRLLTAMFLHFGPVHLVMNLLGLAVIGPWAEKALGHARYALVYFVAGIGSMAAVVLFIRQGWMHEEVLVGASGAIMGLVGATGAFLAVGWRRERSGLAARRLRGIALVVVFQVVFDLLTPQVSFAAHAAGVCVGAGVTVLLLAGERWFRRPRG